MTSSSRGEPNAGDGRGIDPRMGTLAGEGAAQAVPADRLRAEGSAPSVTWTGLTDRTDGGGAPTYYDLPVLKEPVWIWAVPAYFAVGGAAGAALVLGAAAQVVDRQGLADLVRWSRRLGATGCAVGSCLLIYDLGRPERFLNMLRVFRPTSPLNVGSWVLAGASSASAAAALLADGTGGWGAAGDLAGLGAGLLGMPLAGYTAVLLSNTAVPLWSAIRRSLPPLFVASAASSAAAVLTFAPLSGPARRVVRGFAAAGLAAELVSAKAVERAASRVERVGRPLHEGPPGSLWRAAAVCAAAGLVLTVAPGRGAGRRRAGAFLTTVGGVAMRFAIFLAGKASSRDPRATFEQQVRSEPDR